MGDLVKVTVQVEVGKAQRYVVLDDPLPAGLVAVNTALKTEQYLAPSAGEYEGRKMAT